MLLPLVIRDIPGSDGSDALSPYGYAGPARERTDDPRFLRAAPGRRRVRARAEGVAAFVRLHPLLNAAPPEGIGTLVRHGETVSIDLTLPTEELWAQTRLDHRRDITRAVRLGYVARMDEDWRHLESFKHLYRATMARRSAAPFYFFEDAYFDGLRDALGESLHLCVVEKDGVIAAAGLFVETNGIVQYHLSGMGDAFRMVQPTKLMMHFVRGWCQERGDRACTFWRVSGSRRFAPPFQGGLLAAAPLVSHVACRDRRGCYRRLVGPTILQRIRRCSGLLPPYRAARLAATPSRAPSDSEAEPGSRSGTR